MLDFQARRVTITFIMSVCLSVCEEEFDIHYNDIYAIWYLSIFEKSVDKIHV